MRNGVKAFTIIELIVVMAISAILFLSMLIFVTHSQNIFNFRQKQSEKLHELSVFNRVVKRDVSSANEMFILKDKIFLKYKNAYIIYVISNKYTIRKDDNYNNDTFNVDIVDYGSYNFKYDDTIRVNTMDVLIKLDIDTIRLSFRKQIEI